MASKLCRNRALASALRPAKPSVVDASVVRCFATTARANVAVPKDAPNPRAAPRDHITTLKAPLVNPADKYQSKADNMHKYGSWLMGCLPKYIQQFSVWKDELTIFICPSGVVPVLNFLKCKPLFARALAGLGADIICQTTPPLSSPSSATLPPSTSPPATNGSRLSTTCSVSATTLASG